MKKFTTYFLLLGLIVFSNVQGVLGQNVNVSGAVVGNGTYLDLSSAFTAINGGAQGGAVIVIDIIANTAEPVTGAVLNAGTWTSMLIRPQGGSFTVTSAVTAGFPLIDLNGADNVTIDGLNSGGNALTISNTTVSATSATSTIRLQADAVSNTITRCTVLGASNMTVLTNGGNIYFGAGSATTGNDNNTVSFCDIGPVGANLPTKGIYSNGTSAAINNSGNIISNNNIFDYFSATVASAGIFVSGGSSDWTIQNNKLFQTALRTQTTGTIHAGIQLASANINNCLISANTIGFANSTGTGFYTLAGVAATKFNPILISGHGTTTATSIQGNTITNITMNSSPYSGISTAGPFIAINVTAATALVNIGNVVGNLIGSTTANSVINFTSSGVAAIEIMGIYFFPSSSTIISNNQIGGFVLNPGPAGHVFYGIQAFTATTQTNTIQNNIIGTTAGPIGNAGLGATSQTVGIRSRTGTSIVTGNVVSNLGMVATNVGTGPASSIIGIWIDGTGATGTNNVSQNTIQSLGQNSAGAVSISGLVYNGPAGANHSVAKNNIHTLVPSSATSTLNGIFINAGVTTYSNNMIRLGYDASGVSVGVGCNINGIAETVAGTDNMYHNSVYIGGNGVGGTNNTFAFQSSIITNTRNFINNIFYNARNNGAGTGKHYAISVGGTTPNPAGLTTNFNDLLVSGTGGVLGLFNAIDQPTLAAWQAATGQDNSSISSNPQYLNPTGSALTGDLHINSLVATAVEQGGTLIGTITDDIDNQLRAGLTPTDIGADALNGIALDLSAPIITYTPLGFICSTGDRTLTATITDASGVPTAGILQPRIYFRKNAGAYFSTQGVLTSGSGTNGTWTFTINAAAMGGLVLADAVSYFVIAQDIALPSITSNPSVGLVATDVNTVTTPPTTPNSYTINAPMSGTYTVGAAGIFPTLTAAVTAYNNSCLAGPIVFSLIDPAYPGETFPITVLANADASAINTLTIKPAVGISPLITGTNAIGILKLSGADFITIDGSNTAGGTTRDLTFQNTNVGATSTVIWLNSVNASNGATNNTIKNSIVKGNSGTTTLASILASGSAVGAVAETANTNNTYQNNTASTSQYGIAIVGPVGNETGTVINLNTVGSAIVADKIGYRGIAIFQQQNALVADNTVSGISSTVTSAAGVAGSGGIAVNGSQSGGSIIRNKISDIKNINAGGYGSHGIVLNSTSLSVNMLVANNFISDVTGMGFGGNDIADNGQGIAVNAGSGFNIYNNTVLINTNQTNPGRAAAFWVSAVIPANALDVRNNIFTNTQTAGGERWAIFAGGISNNIFTTINYNDYYTAGVNLGSINAVNYTNLAGIQGGFGGNLNSVNILPVFVGAPDLHLPAASNITLNGTGTPLVVVPLDIDLEVRNLATPDIGADEFCLAPTVPTVLASVNPSCANAPTMLTVSAGSLYDAVDWQWYSGSCGGTLVGSGDTIIVTPATTTSYFVRGEGGCVPSGICQTITITVNTLPTVTYTVSPNDSVCPGTNVTLTGAGANTYTWTGGITDATAFVPAISATYTVTGTDLNGCTNTASAPIVVNPLPIVNYTALPSTTVCIGSNVTLSGTGASSYTWTGGITNATPFAALVNATYTVTGTSTAGCTNTASASIVVNSLPVVNLGPDQSQCSGTVNLDAGNPGSTYLWSTAATSQTIVVATSNVIIATVTDINGCSNSDTVDIIINSNPTVALGSDVVQCGGSVLLDAGNVGATYLWSNAATSQTISAASTGTYSVVATLPGGCTASDTINITINSFPIPTANNTGPYCAGATIQLNSPTGSATDDWTGPLAYTQNNVQNPTIALSTVAMSGDYTVTVTNGSGCSATATTTVVVNALPTPIANNTGPYCAGATIQLNSPSGSATDDWTGPLAYAQNNVQNPTIALSTVAMSGDYTVTVTNGSGCSATATTTVVVNALPTPTANNTGPYCVGATIQLNSPSGSATDDWTGPLAYAQNNVQNPTIALSTVAMSGDYTVTVTNGSGCSATATTTVVVNALPTPSANNTGPYCAGATIQLNSPSGSATDDWSGPLAYAQNNVQNPTIALSTVAMSGDYTVTVTNGSGCSATATTTVVVNALPTPSANNTGPYCAGATIQLNSPTGSATDDWTGPSAYTQNNVQNPTIALSTVAMSGVYTVTVTNGSGCSATATTTVVVNALPTPTANNTGPYCIGATIQLNSPSGSATDDWTGPLAYAQNNVQNPTIASATVGMSGVYTVTVTNGSGCSATATTTVVVNVLPSVNLGADVVQANPPAILDAGAGFTTYLWSTTASTQTISVNTNGQYIVTVTNAFGCSDSDTINVNFTSGIVNVDGTPTKFSLYPNPTSDGIFSVSVENIETSNLVMDVIDMNGSVVHNKYVGSVSGNVIEPFSLTDLRMGAYVMRITANGKSTQLRFIINK